MQFTMLPHSRPRSADRELSGAETCYLLRDNWDDYSYKTTFSLVYFDDGGERHDVGTVKIMRSGMEFGYTALDEEFTEFEAGYASLGQSQDYYENLMGLGEEARVEILTALRDVVWDQELYEQVHNEEPFKFSLTRSIGAREITKFKAVIHQEATLTPFHFQYAFPKSDAVIEIVVQPDSTPPSNIHVIIGRNGVGKTSLLRALSDLLRNGQRRGKGRVTFIGEDDEIGATFTNLVTVAFSAFDEFDPPTSNEGTKTGIKYTYIGLRKHVRLKSGEHESRNKTVADLRKDFVRSTLTCLRSSRLPRWRAAMRVLEGDPLFASLRLTELADLPQEEFEEEAVALFDAASSGHKIVLLTMTQLVELVSERTLVLIDEPEAHLHPPLAASFIRALSDLLSKRNGVAILATHSPVIVQEVPSNCVSLFFRTGDGVAIERPTIETFAENVGLLTREIFRVELTESGYHQLIARAVDEAHTIEQAIGMFDDKLGAEGRSIVRALWQER